MARIKYTGPADYRILDASDLKSLGVEGFTKTVFRQNTPRTIDDQFVDVLVKDVGNFEVVPDDAPAPATETHADESNVVASDAAIVGKKSK